MKTLIKSGMSTDTVNSILKSETLSTVELVLFLFDSQQGQFEYFLMYPNNITMDVIASLKAMMQTIIENQKNCTKSIEKSMEQSLTKIIKQHRKQNNF